MLPLGPASLALAPSPAQAHPVVTTSVAVFCLTSLFSGFNTRNFTSRNSLHNTPVVHATARLHRPEAITNNGLCLCSNAQMMLLTVVNNVSLADIIQHKTMGDFIFPLKPSFKLKF